MEDIIGFSCIRDWSLIMVMAIKASGLPSDNKKKLYIFQCFDASHTNPHCMRFGGSHNHRKNKWAASIKVPRFMEIKSSSPHGLLLTPAEVKDVCSEPKRAWPTKFLPLFFEEKPIREEIWPRTAKIWWDWTKGNSSEWVW